MDEKKVGIHKISLVERQNLCVTGVMKVNSANNNCVSLKLKEGDLNVLGSNLNITVFGENSIELTGDVDSLKYSKTNKEKTNFFKRIFK